MYGHNYDTVYNTALVTKPIGDPLEASRYIDEVEFSGGTFLLGSFLLFSLPV